MSVAGAAVCSALPMTVPGPARSYEEDSAVGSTGRTERVEALQEGNTAAEETHTSVKVLLPPRKPDMLHDSAVGDVSCVTDVPWVGSAHLVEDGGAARVDDTASMLALSSVGCAEQSACFSQEYEREPTPADRAATQELPDSDEAATDVEPVVGAELARAVGPHNVQEPPPADEAAVNTLAHSDQAAAYGDLVVGAEFAPALENNNQHEPSPAHEAAAGTLPDSEEAAAYVHSVVGAEIAQAVWRQIVHEPVAVGGPTAGRVAAPQLRTAHPRGGPKISRSGPARE